MGAAEPAPTIPDLPVTDPGIKRMPIKATRALLNAALDGKLYGVAFRKDPNFGFEAPFSVPALDDAGVDQALLDPRATNDYGVAAYREGGGCLSQVSRNPVCQDIIASRDVAIFDRVERAMHRSHPRSSMSQGFRWSRKLNRSYRSQTALR